MLSRDLSNIFNHRESVTSFRLIDNCKLFCFLVHNNDCRLGKTYQYVFSSMSLSLSCNCFHDVDHKVLLRIHLFNTTVNHHQTSFGIAFALTDCDIHITHVVSRQISLKILCFYRLSRCRQSGASSSVDIERGHSRHCRLDGINHRYHHRYHLVLPAQR